MRRLQVLIDEDLDANLERESSRTGRSKGALVRDALRQQLKPSRSIELDAIFELAGAASFDPVAPEAIDDVVYGDP